MSRLRRPLARAPPKSCAVSGPGLVEALAGRLVLGGEARRHPLLVAQPLAQRLGLADHRAASRCSDWRS